MSDTKQMLQRARDRFEPPEDVMGSLIRRREQKERNRRISAAVIGIAVALLSLASLTWVLRSAERPADQPTPTLPELRRDGEIIVFEPLGTGQGRDLGAQDPETGELRKIVETQGIIQCPDPCISFPKSADWSSDDRWVAFEISFGSLDRSPWGPCGPTAGIWVKNALDGPRQLTTPCDAPPPTPPGSEAHIIEELWAWSPAGAQLAYARIDGEADELFLIDASDGRRTPLGTANSNITTLEWSPDGTRIAYADGGSVYEVRLDGGDRSLLGDSFVDIVNIEWSPDGTRIMVLDKGRNRLQVMNADASGLHVLVEGEDACCDPEWSPDGDRIAYMISAGEPDLAGVVFEYEIQIWTVSPDGTDRIKVFDSGCCVTGDHNPVWSPDGTQVAYMFSSVWQVANGDGTGEAQPIDELLVKSWRGGGFSGEELIGRWEG